MSKPTFQNQTNWSMQTYLSLAYVLTINNQINY